MYVRRIGGQDKAGEVAVIVGAGAGVASGGDTVEQRQQLGHLGGALGDLALADDDALAVHQRGEQLHFDVGQFFPGTREHLAVQGDRGQRARLPGRCPRLLNLGCQPAADRSGGLMGVDHLHVAADRRLVRRAVEALYRVKPCTQPRQRVLRQVSREITHRAEAAPGAGQSGRDHHGQGRCDVMPDAAAGARVGDLLQRLQQAGAPARRGQHARVDDHKGPPWRCAVGDRPPLASAAAGALILVRWPAGHG